MRDVLWLSLALGSCAQANGQPKGDIKLMLDDSPTPNGVAGLLSYLADQSPSVWTQIVTYSTSAKLEPHAGGSVYQASKGRAAKSPYEWIGVFRSNALSGSRVTLGFFDRSGARGQCLSRDALLDRLKRSRWNMADENFDHGQAQDVLKHENTRLSLTYRLNIIDPYRLRQADPWCLRSLQLVQNR